MKLVQSASSVWMVRPVNFYGNTETVITNAFQQSAERVSMKVVLNEYDTAVSLLQKAGINVIVTQSVDEEAPDSLFPNNWVSYHHDGTEVVYPMMAISRRRERNLRVPPEIAERFHIQRTLDLTEFEQQHKFLEGTGSIVFDHASRKAYAVRSERTNEEVLQRLCIQLNYTTIIFSAVDKNQRPVYHTNVVMNIGDEFAVICSEAIADTKERTIVCTALSESGKELLLIDQHQMHSFAGNMLQLCNAENEKILVLSATAYSSLTSQQIALLEKHATLITVDIPTIEQQGGGSIRCMIAEIFLPKK